MGVIQMFYEDVMYKVIDFNYLLCIDKLIKEDNKSIWQIEHVEV